MRIVYYIGCILVSVLLVQTTGLTAEPFFEINNQITYLGVLIGFALTLYTFGLSILKDIYENIEKITFKKIENKIEIFQSLKDSFKEIKQNIYVIFTSIILLFVNAILANTINPFGLDVTALKIPETISVSVFLLSSLALYDIMQGLFNLSKIIFKE